MFGEQPPHSPFCRYAREAKLASVAAQLSRQGKVHLVGPNPPVSETLGKPFRAVRSPMSRSVSVP